MKQKKRTAIPGGMMGLIGIILLVSGVYILSLVGAPMVMPVISMRPISAEVLATKSPTDNRIIIPKIGVDIPYDKGEVALDNGAQWRRPERGNPHDGGNFIIAAHRFTLAATPSQTVRQSPFYHIDKLTVGDQIVVDYDGRRYGYEVYELNTVAPNQVEIESAITDSRLTLYSCGLGGADDLRQVIFAKPLGEVSIDRDATDAAKS